MGSHHPPGGVIPPPPGYNVNMDSPVRKMDDATYIVSGVGIAISTMFLAMRIYTKARILRLFGAEDILIIIAWMCGITTQALVIHNFQTRGEGSHLWEISLETYNHSQKLILAASAVYVPCLGCAKFSLLLLYRRLAPRKWFGDKWFHIGIYSVMTVVFGYSVAITFALIFACRPLVKTWDASIPGHCINRPAIYVMTAVVNIGTDVVILLLSIPIASKLRLPLVQKVGIVCMFGVGSMTIVTSIVRLITLFPMLTSPDQSWAVATPSVWICVEANLVIICSSLPVLRQFLRHLCPKLIGESAGTHGSSSRGSSDAYRLGSNEQPDPYSLEMAESVTKRELALGIDPSHGISPIKNAEHESKDDSGDLAMMAGSRVPV